MIKNYISDKIKNRIMLDLDFLAFYTKSKIKKISGTEINHKFSYLNHKCHLNSFDLYKKDSKFKVVMAWCYSPNSKTDWFVHFLNYNIETKEYWDDTLGGESIVYYYYILHDTWLDKKLNGENPNPSSWLGILKEDFYNRYVTSWIEKIFIKKDDL